MTSAPLDHEDKTVALDDDAERLATIIQDYREGEVRRPDAAHVLRWIEQFPEAVREPVLAETTHVLAQTYVNKDAMIRFLNTVAQSEKFAGGHPARFWRGVSFLRLQQVGDSQRDMLALFDAVLLELFGFDTRACGADPHTYVYLDDGIFTGGRVRQDLVKWIQRDAPREVKVAVIVIAAHRGGEYYARTQIEKAAKDVGKALVLDTWYRTAFEDRKAYIEDSDVLRPKRLPSEAAEYAATLRFPPELRHQDGLGDLELFSSPAARDRLEQEFLKAGVTVRELCPLLPGQMRPLGAMLLETLGFGTMFVTHRNIANNAPLALWAGRPWYPLFERRTNVRA